MNMTAQLSSSANHANQQVAGTITQEEMKHSDMDCLTKPPTTDKPVIITVGGDKHEVLSTTLQRFPDTKLARELEMSTHYRYDTGDYFFDRHPRVFSEILNYYRTGKLHIPQDVCISVFNEEIEYWGLNITELEDCCWLKFSEHMDILSSIKGVEQRSQERVPIQADVQTNNGTSSGRWRRFKISTWSVLDEPQSCTLAKIYAFVSITFILLSLFVICAMTHPAFKIQMKANDYAKYYQVSDVELAQDWGEDYLEGSEELEWFRSLIDKPDYLDSILGKVSEEKEEEEEEFQEGPMGETGQDGQEEAVEQKKEDSLGEGKSETRKKRNTIGNPKSLFPKDKEKTFSKQAFEEQSPSELDDFLSDRKKVNYHKEKINKLQRIMSDKLLERHRRDAVNSTAGQNATGKAKVYSKLPNLHPPHPVLNYIDLTCFAFFLADMIMRFTACPNRIWFFKSVLNWIDLIANLSFTIEILLDSIYPQERFQENILDSIAVLKILRVFKIFRVLRYSKGWRVLTLTLRNSFKEICLLILFVGTGVLFFAVLVYYADAPSKIFQSIPDACWWAIVTMTTVGYGDLSPKTFLGRIVGTLCAISGVLMIGFTVPVIVNNFMLFYQYLSADRRSAQFKKVSPHGNPKNEDVEIEKKIIKGEENEENV